MFVEYNPNPNGSNVGDCVIRSLTLATGKDWETVYIELSMLGFELRDMPSANYVWGAYLKGHGFRKNVIPDLCPECYTIIDFCNDNQNGLFVLATGSHVVTAIDGDYYDSWDSGNEVPIYYWSRRES